MAQFRVPLQHICAIETKGFENCPGKNGHQPALKLLAHKLRSFGFSQPHIFSYRQMLILRLKFESTHPSYK